MSWLDDVDDDVKMIIADPEILRRETTLQHLHDMGSHGEGEEGVKDKSEAAVAATAVRSAAGEGGAPSHAGLSAQGRTAEVQRPRVRAVGARAERVRLGGEPLLPTKS